MFDSDDRSAYPRPTSFSVMRPAYEDQEDGTVQASITVSPYTVTGVSTTRPGARRAALHQAHKTYRAYHAAYVIPSPFPDAFTDQEGTRWERATGGDLQMGDYRFIDDHGEEDFADIDQMLLWDVRPELDYD